MRRLIVATARVVSVALAGALAGCAAASPLLVEPRAPAVGDMRATVGGAAIVPFAGDNGAIVAARNAGTGPDAAAKNAAGLTESTLIHPGIAPVVRAQVGVTPQLEASLRYGGRDLGVGGRWFFFESRTEQGGATTLSVGLEGRMLLKARQDDGLVPASGADRGGGATVPLIVAWQSDAGLVSAYFGALFGFDYAKATATEGTPDSFRRYFGAGTVGIGVGFRRVRAIVELGLERDFAHAELTGTPGQSVDLRLWSLTPAFALSIRL